MAFCFRNFYNFIFYHHGPFTTKSPANRSRTSPGG